MEKTVSKKTVPEKVLAAKPEPGKKKKPRKLTSKQRIDLVELDNKNRAFQNECLKKVQAIETIFVAKTNDVNTKMSDLVRPIRIQHEKDIKAAKQQHEQDKRNLEKKFKERCSDIHFAKSSALLDIENNYNVAMGEMKDIRNVAVEKIEATLQVFIREDHLQRQKITKN